jgi:hypothetical protein
MKGMSGADKAVAFGEYVKVLEAFEKVQKS